MAASRKGGQDAATRMVLDGTSDRAPPPAARNSETAPGRLEAQSASPPIRSRPHRPERSSGKLALGPTVPSPARPMSEISLEELISERQFSGLLQTHAAVFFRLSNTLLAPGCPPWNKKHYFQLSSEADALESFLDDYGAPFNRSYCYTRELVASVRGFALTGYSVAHLAGRLESYGAPSWMSGGEFAAVQRSLARVLLFLRETVTRMLQAARLEMQALGAEMTPEGFPESNFMPVVARRRLPRNMGQADLLAEEQKIAEVAAKYLQACQMLSEIGVRPLADSAERERFLARVCTEEQARVYEATVHNLQSTYDTHIRNTKIEASDQRLSQLRGHASAALHMLEAVTQLVHFIERHESEVRSEEAKRRISDMVDRALVQEMASNELLVWADRFLQSGAHLAEELLAVFTNVQELEIELPERLNMHA